MSEKFEVVEHGLKHLLAELVKERDEAPERAKRASHAASKSAAGVLRAGAKVRTGFVRTFVDDTDSGSRVRAVSSRPVSPQRLKAAVDAGVSEFGGEAGE